MTRDRAEHRAATTETTLRLGDVALRATVTGTGPTVLLLHAGRERRGVWAPIAARLDAAGLRTVAVDLRGHGESSGVAATLRSVAGDVIELVAHEPAPVVVVGASLGGVSALAALADPPTVRRVAGLVLVDVVPEPDPDQVHRWLRERVRVPLRAHDAELVADILRLGPDLLATAAALTVPVLLVRAGGHTPVDDAAVERLRAANRRVTVVSVPDAGHLVARDAPVELARILAATITQWVAP